MNQNLSALTNELKNRARIYVHIYKELSREIGREKAMEVLKHGLYGRGREKGLQLKASPSSSRRGQKHLFLTESLQ